MADDAADNQRAIQLRGMVVHDIVRDLQAFAQKLNDVQGDKLPTENIDDKGDGLKSVPFSLSSAQRISGAIGTRQLRYEYGEAPLPDQQRRCAPACQAAGMVGVQ